MNKIRAIYGKTEERERQGGQSGKEDKW
jgi:hypothetical protein